MNDVDFRQLARIAAGGGPLAERVVEHLRSEIQRLESELARSREETRRLRFDVLEVLRIPNPLASDTVHDRGADERPRLHLVGGSQGPGATQPIALGMRS